MIYIKKNTNFFININESVSVFNTLINFGAHIGDLYYYRHFQQTIQFYLTCIRNDFFIFDLRKTVVLLQRALNFVYRLGLLNGRLLFYHYEIDSYFFKFIFYHLVYKKSKHSFINKGFSNGTLSNYKNCFLRFIKILYNVKINIVEKKIRHYSLKKHYLDSYINSNLFFRYIFLKLLYMTYEKSFLKRDWLTEFDKLLVFWRVFCFLRTFKSVFNLPDTIFYVTNNNTQLFSTEYSKSKKIPSIMILDTDISSANCTYPIPSNSHSIPLSLFYISLFLNANLLNSLYKYKTI